MSKPDPTKNVVGLVTLGLKRQDDLRAAEAASVRELINLRWDHESELRQAEKDRLDSIRKIDVEAARNADRAAESRANVLANMTENTAEALRSQVERTGKESNSELKAALTPLIAAIEDLRRWQYQTAGERQQVVETRDVSSGKSEWVAIFGAIGFGVVSAVLSIVNLLGH